MDYEKYEKDEAIGRAVQASMLAKAECMRAAPTNDEIVSHHIPTPEEIRRIETIRAAARNFLDAIDSNCPGCVDATDAKRKVREAMMTANAAIALRGLI